MDTMDQDNRKNLLLWAENAALGQWVAENAEDFLDVGCKDVLSASREVH